MYRNYIIGIGSLQNFQRGGSKFENIRSVVVEKWSVEISSRLAVSTSQNSLTGGQAASSSQNSLTGSLVASSSQNSMTGIVVVERVISPLVGLREFLEVTSLVEELQKSFEKGFQRWLHLLCPWMLQQH